ncbi:DUF4105 domain-containing protein [Spirochaeta cellobiosiphila]|uniref:lipoprotein N-acyltransferase Lnb domain-containing protein n=1 Tax=Spirochaeta cellobiosiphila TaxID=504483 RepID=UPI000419D31C|nr:DUF4105 domain-containing protein [Spirochaeta cellobiosiphila]
MKKLIFILILLISSSYLFADDLDQFKIGPHAQFSLITVSDGPELYATFGHTIIRIKDIENNIDWAVDWGKFDFNTEGFYFKFIRGRLNYLMDVTLFRYALQQYVMRDLTLTEQVLRLDTEEKQDFFEFIKETYKPENRFYKYDFFKDNCATRIGEYLLNAFPEVVRFNAPYEGSQTSYQRMIQPHLKVKPWTGMGINIILGQESDKEILNHNKMFLPHDLMEAVDNAEVYEDGQWLPLVMDKHIIYQSRGITTLSVPPFYRQPLPYTILLLLIGMILFYLERKQIISLRIYDIVANVILSILTIFLLFMWLGTDHSATALNLNILWTFPWGLLLIQIPFMKSNKLKLVFTSFLALLNLWFITRGLWSTAFVNPSLVPVIVFVYFHNIHIIWKKS